MTPAEFERMQKRIRALEEEVAESKGALDQLLAELKRDHQCSSIEEARQLLDKLQQEVVGDEEKLDRKWKAFEKKWNGKLSH